MSKASSRVFRIGTVYSRTKALLDKGIMRPENKPIWYDVYEKFPPRIPPEYFRPVDPRPPVDIVYREDIVRAKFFSVFENPEILNLKSKKLSTVQTFVNEYIALEEKHPELSFGEIFDLTAASLKDKNFKLKSFRELKKEKVMLETSLLDDWKHQEENAMETVSTSDDHVKDTLKDQYGSEESAFKLDMEFIEDCLGDKDKETGSRDQDGGDGKAT